MILILAVFVLVVAAGWLVITGHQGRAFDAYNMAEGLCWNIIGRPGGLGFPCASRPYGRSPAGQPMQPLPGVPGALICLACATELARLEDLSRVEIAVHDRPDVTRAELAAADTPELPAEQAAALPRVPADTCPPASFVRHAPTATDPREV